MRSLIVVFVALFGFGGAFAQTIELERGQVWTFRDAPSQDARIVIGDIESLWNDKSIAVSVSITDIPTIVMENGAQGGGAIAHLPFDVEVLKPELLKLESSKGDLSEDYDEGYAMWKKALNAGEAGIFTITVAEAIELVRNTIMGNI